MPPTDPADHAHDAAKPVGDQVVDTCSRLRQVAASYLMRLQPGQTAQPTEFVHEAYLRLDGGDQPWRSRSQLLAFASKSIRNRPVDQVRRKTADKRGGSLSRVTLATGIAGDNSQDLDLIDLHQTLERLTAVDERQGRIVEMQFFGGMSTEEIAATLELSSRSIRGELRMAQSWRTREREGKQHVTRNHAAASPEGCT